MKFLKYYYIFNEANFSEISNLSNEEKLFLDMVKKNRPQEYNKFLTYVKNKKNKGLWYAIQKYNESDPKKIKEKEKENKYLHKANEYRAKTQAVVNLIPTLKELDEIFLNKFREPYENFWKYFYGTDCPFEYFKPSKNMYENVTDLYILSCSTRYRDTKRASCSANNNGSITINNTPEGVANFISNYLDNNKLTINKLKEIKQQGYKLYGEYDNFLSLVSHFQIYIRTSMFATSVYIDFNITFGASYHKYNVPIFKTNKKVGTLKNGKDYSNSEHTTKEEVIKIINEAFNSIILEMDKKKDNAKYNMQNIIANIILDSASNPKMVALAGKYPKLNNILVSKLGQDNMNTLTDLDKDGFFD